MPPGMPFPPGGPGGPGILPVAGHGALPALPPGQLPGPDTALTMPVNDPHEAAFTNAFDLCPEEERVFEECFSMRAEFMWIWLRPQKLFPMATQGNLADPIPGALGQPNTRVLNNDQQSNSGNPAGRITLTWCPFPPEALCFDVNWFMMQQGSSLSNFSGDGSAASPVLARPFFNPNAGVEDADPRNLPGILAGGISSTFTSRIMGGEANARLLLNGNPRYGLSCFFLTGPRYLRIDERFQSQDSVRELGNLARTFFISDTFTTYNEFFGGQFGFVFRYRQDDLALQVTPKLAIGNIHETAIVDGLTVVQNANLFVTDQQGLYAQPSNIGRYVTDRISFLPEVEVDLTWFVTERIRFKAGYSFVFLSDMVRPVDQIDRRVNIQPLQAPAQIGVALPARPTLEQTDFWMHWLRLGLEFAF